MYARVHSFVISRDQARVRVGIRGEHATGVCIYVRHALGHVTCEREPCVPRKIHHAIRAVVQNVSQRPRHQLGDEERPGLLVDARAIERQQMRMSDGPR